VARVRRIEHAAVKRAVLGGGDGQHHVVQHRVVKIVALDNLHACTGASQKGNFAIGNLARPYNQYRAIVNCSKERQVIHGATAQLKNEE
jgi:hypothetical protein